MSAPPTVDRQGMLERAEAVFRTIQERADAVVRQVASQSGGVPVDPEDARAASEVVVEDLFRPARRILSGYGVPEVAVARFLEPFVEALRFDVERRFMGAPSLASMGRAGRA